MTAKAPSRTRASPACRSRSRPSRASRSPQNTASSGLAGERTYTYQYAANRPAPGVSTRAKVRFNEDYNHSVMLGVRYAFNAAPPPPPAAPVAQAPAREAARTYLVFFDWDRADLTPRARQVVSEAAQATTRVQVTRIQVNGYTDTSGTPRYNQGLSVRRAQDRCQRTRP